MNTKITKLLLATAAALMAMTLSAQDRPNKISREALAVKQAEHISRTLAFDKATGDRFKDTYCSFQKEVWALGPRPEKMQSDKAGEDQMRQRFDRSQKMLDLRRKYYDIYSTFLSQEQVSRVYEIERDMMHKLAKDKPQASKHRQSKTRAKGNAHR